MERPNNQEQTSFKQFIEAGRIALAGAWRDLQHGMHLIDIRGRQVVGVPRDYRVLDLNNGAPDPRAIIPELIALDFDPEIR